jgi:hypothetical protein
MLLFLILPKSNSQGKFKEHTQKFKSKRLDSHFRYKAQCFQEAGEVETEREKGKGKRRRKEGRGEKGKEVDR